MARTGSGVKLLCPLPGTAEAKARLAAILATLSGDKTIGDACAELGVGEARFHELRKEFLAGALELLERRAPGRKPIAAREEATPERVASLAEENRRLRVEIEAQRLRTEIALVMPRLLPALPADTEEKKKKRRKRRR